jgi:hypothetical protein
MHESITHLSRILLVIIAVVLSTLLALALLCAQATGLLDLLVLRMLTPSHDRSLRDGNVRVVLILHVLDTILRYDLDQHALEVDR